MARDASFHEYVMHDVLAGIPGITSRPMFGGYGIYKNNIIFALIAESQLYLKVDETNKPDFQHRGSHPFVYSGGNHKEVELPYWLLPEEIMEDKELLEEWVNASVQATKRSKQ